MAIKRWKTAAEIKAERESKNKRLAPTLENIQYDAVLLFSDGDFYSYSDERDSSGFMVYDKSVKGHIELRINSSCNFYVTAESIDEGGTCNVELYSDYFPFSEVLERMPDTKMLQSMKAMIEKELLIREGDRDNLLDK